MENHPIPQDVTGFKFKLIGSVTIKQFLYLLGMGILAVIVFVLPLPFLARLPFIVLFSGIGIALAFIPIDGRPMDVMIKNFAKAVPAENRYIYRKRGVSIPAFEFVRIAPKKEGLEKEKGQDENEQKRALFLRQLKRNMAKPDQKELEVLNTIKGFFDESTIARDIPQIKADHSKPALQELSPPLQRKEEQQKIDVEQKPKETADAFAKQSQDQKDSTEIGITSSPVRQGKDVTQDPKNIHAVSAQTQVQAGFPSIPDVANVILGIVKDPRGRVIQNIIVEVLDQNNIPVRAFKTNALGQFSSATPLPNGIYKISIEDNQKKHEFETIEIELKGEIFSPLEIFSTDDREKLRQELFGAGIPAQQ